MGAGIHAGYGARTGLKMGFPVQVFLRLAGWSVVALGLAVPLSTALDNLLLLALLPLVLIGNAREALRTALHNPVARASVLLFLALLAGMLYGEASFKEALDILGKYADLAFVPLLMVAGRDVLIRGYVIRIFLLVMSVTALWSWLIGLHILPVTGWMWRGCLPDNPAIFRSSITQNILMAYAVHLLVLHAYTISKTWLKWTLLALAGLMAGDVLFMVQGKTGYLVLFALLVYLAWTMLARKLFKRGRRIGWKEGAGIALAGLLLIFAAYQFSPRLHERVDAAVAESHGWQPNVNNPTSTGARLEFYYNTLAIIEHHPLLGVGTGGFPAAYARQVQGKDVLHSTNPHNEYLLVAVQVGVAGFVLLLYLFYTQWRCALRLPGVFERDAARGLVLTIAVAALFNSPLHDHTEGLFFALASALLFSSLTPEKRNG